MSNDITTILKEAVGEDIAKETLDRIETVFNEAVESRANIRVEKALVEQDTQHAEKLEKLLEAIDDDHTKKLEKVVESLDKNHAQKLVQLVKKYEHALNEDASTFKSNLVESISSYIEEYIDEKIPVQDIQEAVKNKKAVKVLESLRSTLGVDFALAKDTIKDAINEGKTAIDESNKTISTLNEQNSQLSNELTQLKAQMLLNEKTQDLPKEKRNYIFRVLSDKTPEFITENFDYTLRLFAKTEEEKIEECKREAVASRPPEVDRPITESAEPVEQNTESDLNPLGNVYMSELGKF